MLAKVLERSHWFGAGRVHVVCPLPGASGARIECPPIGPEPAKDIRFRRGTLPGRAARRCLPFEAVVLRVRNISGDAGARPDRPSVDFPSSGTILLPSLVPHGIHARAPRTLHRTAAGRLRWDSPPSRRRFLLRPARAGRVPSGSCARAPELQHAPSARGSSFLRHGHREDAGEGGWRGRKPRGGSGAGAAPLLRLARSCTRGGFPYICSGSRAAS